MAKRTTAETTIEWMEMAGTSQRGEVLLLEKNYEKAREEFERGNRHLLALIERERVRDSRFSAPPPDGVFFFTHLQISKTYIGEGNHIAAADSLRRAALLARIIHGFVATLARAWDCVTTSTQSLARLATTHCRQFTKGHE